MVACARSLQAAAGAEVPTRLTARTADVLPADTAAARPSPTVSVPFIPPCS